MSTNGRAPAAAPPESTAEGAVVGRYAVAGGERVICAQRVERFVHLVDRPAGTPGRCYLIDRCLVRDGSGSVRALVADYTRRARRLQAIPMVAGMPSGIDQVALARYRYSGGLRILYGQRVGGVVRVTDRPASGPGRCYLVERSLDGEDFAALRALVGDYVREARRLDDIPMARTQVLRLMAPAATTCPRSASGSRPRERRRLPPTGWRR